jgi:3-dehydroquinate synthase
MRKKLKTSTSWGYAVTRQTSFSLPPLDTKSDARVFSQRLSISYEFPVAFTRDVFSKLNNTLSDIISGDGQNASHPSNKVAVVIDEGITREMPDLKRRVAAYIDAWPGLTCAGTIDVVAGGEASKNDPELVMELQRRFVNYGLDRHSYVVCVGGGAILDLVGYAAATAHRGIRHIRIPTTVLAQNDSGVGVKNGVNAFGMKNMLGTFAPPYAVINDSAFIDVLPGREKRAGMAEAVKVALIRDRAFFEWLEEKVEALALFASEPLDKLIRHCALLHMRQIAHGGDPFERGSVRPLDFGHWAAHKLEVLSNYELRHGEAVAIGIALDTRYSVLAGLLPAGEDERVLRLLQRLGFSLWNPACDLRDGDGQRRLLKGLEEFREHLGGNLTITLLSELGTGVEVHTMDDRLIGDALDWLRSEANA